MAETVWIVPVIEDAKTFMDSRVVDVSKQNTDGGNDDRLEAMLEAVVAEVREAVRNGGRVAVSLDPEATPPGSLTHVMTLVVAKMCASRPQLAQYAAGEYFQAELKEARDWLKDVADGKQAVTSPSDPDTTSAPSGPAWGDFYGGTPTSAAGKTDGSGKLDLTTD